MRVLIALNHYRMTGVVTFSHVLASYLKKQGHHVDVWFKHVETTDDRVVGWFKQCNSLYIVSPPPQLLPSEKYDVAFCNYVGLENVCKSLSDKVVFVKHGTMFELYDETKLQVDVDRVVCLSQFSYQVTKHRNKLLVDNFVEMPEQQFKSVKSIKTALICDIRHGSDYSPVVMKCLEGLDIVCHSIQDNQYVLDIADHFHRYDLIIGYGRVVREALVRRRRVLVHGLNGGDGFITNLDEFKRSYARNFSGWGLQKTPPVFSVDFSTSLQNYIINNINSNFEDEEIFKKSRELFNPSNYIESMITFKGE